MVDHTRKSTGLGDPDILAVRHRGVVFYYLYHIIGIEYPADQTIPTRKNMKYLSNIGRILFALPFGILGLNHFFMYNYYLMIVNSFIPGGGFTVIITGLALVAACVSIILNKFVRLSCILLAILLLIFIVSIHIPMLFDKANATMALIELFKDTSLMGGALLIAGTYGMQKE